MDVTNITKTPITIVGAGPAGLACAIVLARGGRKVLVREWKADVGHRFHDDFQGLENWSNEKNCLSQLAADGVRPRFDGTPIYQITAYDADGTGHVIKSARPLFYLLRRGPKAGSLDRGLLAQAKAEGVEIRFNDRVQQFEGPTVLAAGPRRADIIAAGYLFETDYPDGGWFSLDQNLAPGGYAYLLVHKGRGTLASCMYKNFDRQADYVERTLAFFSRKLDIEYHNKRKFGGYGSWSAVQSPVQGGQAVVGEQVGAQDALAGFGLRYAMNSGILAARCLLEGQNYGDEWSRRILPEIKTGIANRLIFEMMGSKAHGWALRGLANSNKDPVRRLGKLYSAKGPTRLAYPLAALKNRKSGVRPGCSHVDCKCVWCQHCRTEPSPDLAA